MAQPIDSMHFKLLYKNAKMDVALWEGREMEGKAMPSSISLKLSSDDSSSTVYLNLADAMALANILSSFSTKALQMDSTRRLEAWKKRTAGSPGKASGSEELDRDYLAEKIYSSSDEREKVTRIE